MKIYNLVSGMIPIQHYLKSKNIIRTGEFFFKFALNKEYYIGIDVYKFTSTQKTVLYIYLLDKKDRQLAHYTYVCRNKIYKIIDDAEFYPNRIEEKGLEIACYGKGIRPGQLIRTDSIYLSEQSAIQHEIDVLIDKLPTEKDKDNLYILLNEQGTK